MARDLNKVQITGRLGADPALRYTAHGSAIVTFRVASNRTWRTASGASHEGTEWFRVVAWDRLAEQCHRQLARGAHIYVEGRLQTRQWSDDTGQPRVATEVVASEVIVLDQGREAPSTPAVPANRARPLSGRGGRVRPAAPPAELDAPPHSQPLRLSAEDLPI
ncbi:MAG: single-stranded DNA-binding protein [Chloroflexi bacterium OHK40]